MSTQTSDVRCTGRPGILAAVAGSLLLAVLLAPAPVLADNLTGLTVISVAPDGSETTLTDYRWLVELDKTYHVQTLAGGAADPTAFDPTWDQLNDGHPGGETLSVGFHQSYMPVLAKGCAGSDSAWQTAAACNEVGFSDPDPSELNHYFVSVMPRSGGSIGGAAFKDGDANIIVYVNEHPIPTAQITILLFHDNAPINNAPDLPTEQPGLGVGQTDMSGFQIVVEDAGGRFGASAGVQSQDAFGNLLGTTYDEFGNITGYEPLVTGPDGLLTVKNLAPGKYGISAIPPAGYGWQQTATIEGTKVIDAWVEANEPPFFTEFGPPGYHVFIGYVQEFSDPLVIGTGSQTISGTIVNNHLSRPPDYTLWPGACFGHTTPWVGLNDLSVGLGTGVWAAPTDADCNFSIPDLPDGSYQLVVWDSNLDLIFAAYGITITTQEEPGGIFVTSCSTPDGSCDVGEVPVFQWFHRSEHRVFDDQNANGIWNDDEGASAIETGFVLRWRDGTVYQENVSDGVGAFTFDQVFPFFSWLVAEVDFVRNQATGVTVVVDAGGEIVPPVYGPAPLDDWDITFGGHINPQDQTNPMDPECSNPFVCVENTSFRVDLGPVLTYGFQGFIGQTNAFMWGKRHYPDGENGGVSGMVIYAVTRAENDPEQAAGEPWEPGIPGVTVNLYDRFGTTLLATTTTDSWDESIPTGCKWGNGATGSFMFDPDGAGIGIGPFEQDCWDGLRMFNQARPAVFDGGYAFDAICEAGLNPAGGCDAGFMSPMPVGDYIVEVIPPTGYEILKPEDKNVDFGDEYIQAKLLPPPCVGDLQMVPAELTLFPDEHIPAPFAGTERALCDKKLVTLSTGGNAAADFFMFTEVPVAGHGLGFILDDTQNEFDPNSPNFGEKYAPPFVPVTVRDWTGRIVNKTLSDQYGLYNFLAPSTITANLPQPSGMSPNMLTTCMNDPGDDPNNPDPNWNQQYSTFCYTFQYMPGATTYLDTPVVPVAAFTGPDQFPLDCEFPDGTPRLYSVDVQTNGVGGGPYIPTYEVRDASGGRAPGVFTDGEQTITITSMGERLVQNPVYCNPAAGACPAGTDTINKFVTRDFGFGTPTGTVTLGDLGQLSCIWGEPITCTIPADTFIGQQGTNDGGSATGGRQLMVNRDNGRSTKVGVTLQVGLRESSAVIPVLAPSANLLDTPITDAITSPATPANALILVGPGIYNEMVVMSKPVQLQGWGEGSTVINAIKTPPDKLVIWRDLVDGLIRSGDVDLLPGQELGPGVPEPSTLFTEEGAGVLVLAPAAGRGSFNFQNFNARIAEPTRDTRGARIDGFTIKGADTGGGIVANGYADFLQISNNRISNNSGFFGGGIRIGHPILVDPATGSYTDGENDSVLIHHNQVVFNGGFGGAGGGISMCTGSDSYAITQNWVCGNFSLGDGAGIAHYGVSDGAYQLVDQPGGDDQDQYWLVEEIPSIVDNTVIFNENFNQGSIQSGGGIFVGSAPPLAVGALSLGAGNVRVDSNLLQGNSAGAGDGGGLRLAMVNGQDVADNPNNAQVGGPSLSRPWYAVDVFNNMIVDNTAGLAGGGISIQDALAARIVNNTIANNDSLATASEAFAPGSPNQSTPQMGAGLVSRQHSPQLQALLPGGSSIFTDPIEFSNNIIWHNRQFYFWVDDTSGCVPGDPGCISTYGLCPDPTGALACTGGPAYPVYSDAAVAGGIGLLSPTYTVLSTSSGIVPNASNILGVDPEFVSEYFNGARSAVFQPEINTAIQTPAAFDEGGNYIRPSFGPLSLYCDHASCTPSQASGDGDAGVLFGDYHIANTGSAYGSGFDLAGTYPALEVDFDMQLRPLGASVDIGADEWYPTYPPQVMKDLREDGENQATDETVIE